ncbi:MAG: hypothetical protein Q7T86_02230 [Hyphomicrobiaceae bacterium]|nr:hypothetical protein [Hyphomicrobiaceae bacterium]
MTQRRPVSLSFFTASLAAGLLVAQPAAAQDFFDWLDGSPPKKKQEETFKGEVPEAVQRDSLPELSPPPDAVAPEPVARSRPSGPDASGEPVPRGPDGEADDDGGGGAADAVPQDSQFDPLEARRRRVQGATPATAPAAAPAKPTWQNPDDVPPRGNGGERYAPGSFEDEQQAMPAKPARGRDRNQYDGGPIERRPGGAARQQAPQPHYPDDGPPRDGPRQGVNDQPRYAPQDNAPSRVERGNLDGPQSAAGELPDPWRGLPVAELEENLSKIDLPPRSPAIHGLWLRLITARASSPDPKLAAIRADALNRTGMIREASEALAGAGDVSADPVIATLAARTAIGAGHSEQGCETARSLTSAVAAKMPAHMKGEVILIAGFCAAVSDNKPAAGIAADLAIENGLQDHAGPAALKAIAAGHKPAVERGKKVSLLDYRILQLGGPVDLSYAMPTASPALLAVIARDERADPRTRLAAAEAAAGLNAITIDELAAAYRANADPRHQVELSDAVADAGQPARRAALFVAAETERTPLKKSRVIRAFLDEARRANFYWPALQLMAGPANDLQPIPEVGWFAETAVEASLAGGNFEGVHRWADFAASLDREGRADLRHWLALADIAEPNARDRTQHLVVIEELAQRGRFDAALLHRLATVLDALDTNVPMPLWEAASRTEQPSNGHLPDTGVLSQLQDAAKQRDYARTVLLTMRTIGPNGAEGAHMIALGDSIRALKRAGLESEARRLALEALFPAWPHATNS